MPMEADGGERVRRLWNDHWAPHADAQHIESSWLSWNTPLSSTWGRVDGLMTTPWNSTGTQTVQASGESVYSLVRTDAHGVAQRGRRTV